MNHLYIHTVLVLLLQLQPTYSSGVLTVRLGEFKNPSGRTYDGTCCDPVADEDKSCTDQCDYVMRLIVTGLGRANDHVFLFHRPIKYDSNNIEFEHSDNTLLLTVLFDRWPEDGLVKMNAFFYDYDDFDHTTTLVDWFETDLKQSNSTTSLNTAVWGQYQEQTVVGNRQLDKTLLTFDWSIMEPDDEIYQPTQNEYTRETKQIEYFTTRASSIKEETLPQHPAPTSSHFSPSENTAFYEENYYLTNNDNYILPADYNDAQSYREDAQNKLGNENMNKIDIPKDENKIKSSLLEKLEKVVPSLNKGDNLIETQYGIEGTLEKTEAEYSQNDVSLDLLQHYEKTKDYKHNSISTNTHKESRKAEYDDASTISRSKSNQHSTINRDSSIDQSMPSEVQDVAVSSTDKALYNNNVPKKSSPLLSSGSNMKPSPGDSDASKLETFSNDITNTISIGDIELGTKGLAGASQNTSSLLGNHSNQSNSNTAIKSEESPPRLVFHPRVPYGFTTNYPYYGNFTIHDITSKLSHLVATIAPTSEPKSFNSLHIEDNALRNNFKHQQSENSKQENILIQGEQIEYPSVASETINKSSVAEDKKQANVTMETYMADITSLSKLKKFDTIEDEAKKMTEPNVNNVEMSYSNINSADSIKTKNSPKPWFNAKKFQKSNGELLHHSIQLLKAVKFQTAAPVMWFVTAQRPDILSENQRYQIVYRTSEAFSTVLTPETDSNKSKYNLMKQDILDKNNVFNYAFANVFSQQPIINEVINLTKSSTETEGKTSLSPSYLKNKDDSIQINSFIASPKGPHINITEPLSSQELFPNFLYNIYVPGPPTISSINSSLPFIIQAHSPEKLNITKKPEKPNNDIEFQKSQLGIQNGNEKTLTEIKEKKSNKRTGTNNLPVSEPVLKKDEKQEYSFLEPTKDSLSFVSDKVKLSFKLEEKPILDVKVNNSHNVGVEKAEVLLSYNIPDNNSPMESIPKRLADSSIDNKIITKPYNDRNLENNIAEDKSKKIKIETNKVEEMSHDGTKNKNNTENKFTSKITINVENTNKNIKIDTKNTLVHDSIKSTVPQDATTNIDLQFLITTDSTNSKISSNNNANQLHVTKETKRVSRNDQMNVVTTTVTATKGRENIESTKSYKVNDLSKSGPSSESNENMILRKQDKSGAKSLSRYDDVLNNVISNKDEKLIREDVLTPTLVTWPELHQELSTVNAENTNDVLQPFEIDSKKIRQHHDTLESANYVRGEELNEINTNKNTIETLQEDGNSKNNKYLIPEKHQDIQTTRRKSDLPIYPLVSENQSTDKRMEFSQNGEKMIANVLKEKSLPHPMPTSKQENAANRIDNKETLTEILHPHQKLPDIDNEGVTINSRRVTDRKDIEYTSSSSNTNDVPNDDGIYRTFQRFHDPQSDTENLAGSHSITVTPPAPNGDILEHNAADPFDLMSLFRANIKLLETPTANQNKVTNSSKLSTVKDKNFQKPLLSEVAIQTKKEESVSGKKYYNEAEDKIATADSSIELNKNNKEINKASTSLQNKQLDQNTQMPTKSEFTLTNQHNEIYQYKATSYKSDKREETVLSLSQSEREQVTEKPTFSSRQDQATNHFTEVHNSDNQNIQNSATLKEPREKPGLNVTENKLDNRITQKHVTRSGPYKQTAKKQFEQTKSEQNTKKPIENTKPEERTTQKPVEHTKQVDQTTQKPIDQTKPEDKTTQKPVKLTKPEERATQKPVEHTTQKPIEPTKPKEGSTHKPVGQTEELTTSKPAENTSTQKPVEQTKTKEGSTHKPVGQTEELTTSKPAENTSTQKPVEQTKTKEGSTHKPVGQAKREEETTSKPAENTTTQKPVKQTKTKEGSTHKPAEQIKTEEGTTLNSVKQTTPEKVTTRKSNEQYKLEEETTKKSVEHTKTEEGNTKKPIEQTNTEEETTQIPVEPSKMDEQTAHKSIEYNGINENTTQDLLEQSKSEDITTQKPIEQNKEEYTTLKSLEKNEQGLKIQPTGISTIAPNKENVQTNDFLLETISTVPEIVPSVEIKSNDNTPTSFKSYQLVNSRNMKSNSLPGILHPVLYVPPTEELIKPTLELQIAKQTLNTEMKTLPENGFKLHAIVQNTANVRNQPLQNLPTLKLSEAKAGTKRTNVQNNINLDKLRSYMQVIRYRPTVQVPDRGLYTPQVEAVNSTETSAPMLPKSVERYGSPYQPLVGVSTVFTRYWPAVLGVTIGTMFLLTALITSILCRQRRLLIQRARWLDSPQHLSEPPDPSEYATSSAASLTSDLTRSSVNLMGSRHGSR